MIHLITGQPGAGKTLYALNYARDLAAKGVQVGDATIAREVYYSGIASLKLPWVELDDARKWHEVPVGSIVVIDEAQRIFRMRGVGAAVPAHVEALETHRHSGIDLIVITQHPMLVDTNVRRLVGRHFHLVRVFGSRAATIHEWAETREQCDKSREGSIRHQWVYPSESFGWYHSAEVHTHKRRIPARVWMMVGLPIAIAACIWIAIVSFGPSKPKDDGKTAAKGKPTLGLAGSGPSSAAKSPDQVRREYLEDRVPVVPGLAHTAPMFHKITAAKSIPSPAACISSEDRGCMCFTVQATVLAVPDALCRHIVAGGFFEEWRDEAAIQNERRNDARLRGEGGNSRDRERGDREGAAARVAVEPASVVTMDVPPRVLPTRTPVTQPVPERQVVRPPAPAPKK